MYREYPPAPALAAFVDCYWSLVAEKPATSERRILPDGSLDILFEGRARDALSGHVIGAMTESLVIPPDAAAPIHYVAIRFRPGRAAAFLGVPARLLTDAREDLDALELEGHAELRQRLCEAPTVEAQIACLEAFLLARLERAAGLVDPLVAAVVRRVERGAEALTIEALSAFAGVSRQHLARRFGQHVGLTPKAFVRIMRFRKALAAVESGRPVDWAALAGELGYYDQSHLIADFKEFTGLSPTRWSFER